MLLSQLRGFLADGSIPKMSSGAAPIKPRAENGSTFGIGTWKIDRTNFRCPPKQMQSVPR